MLNAIIHSKSGRVAVEGVDENVSWRTLFHQREDLLTAAFFERFSYLSPIMQHRLLKPWFGGEGDFTTFSDIIYWPKYELAEEGREFVEPDLLLRFADFDVLVEVKPPNGGEQTLDQWQREVMGYFNAQDDCKSLYFAAIGRVPALSVEWRQKMLNGCNVERLAMQSWKQVASQVYALIQSSEPSAAERRVLIDMLEALNLYGVRGRDLRWSEMSGLIGDAPLSLSLLEGWKR